MDDFPRLQRRARVLRHDRRRPRVHWIDAGMLEGVSKAEAVLDRALDQILEGRGATSERPLEGIGVNGMFCLARTLALELESQRPVLLDGSFDRPTEDPLAPHDRATLEATYLRGRDPAGAYRVVLYNLVDPRD